MKKQKIFINGEIKATELDAPTMKSLKEKIARIKPYFSCLSIVPSSLEDTKSVVDILFENKVVMRALLSVTNAGGSLSKRKVSIPAKNIDFQILKENYRFSKIPFIVINEDRGYIEENEQLKNTSPLNSSFIATRFSEIVRVMESNVQNGTSRWISIEDLEEAKLTKRIIKNDADNLVVVPLEQLEEYIFDNVIFQINEQYA